MIAQYFSLHAVETSLGFFFGILILMAIWEIIAPRRKLTVSKGKRWLGNLFMVVINTLIIRIVFPTAAFGVALFAQKQGWGLFNFIEINYWLLIILSVVWLDLIIYLQHIMFHAAPHLWLVHRMHHLDLDFDVTTGIRFHPIEILISLLIKFAAIITIGVPPVAVVIFQILLNGTSMFNHGNVRIPIWLDSIIRMLIVTPDMHRVHHSSIARETNSNFGFNFSFWDRLFGTYKAQPEAGHEKMTIGLNTFRDARHCISLWGLITTPFVGKIGNYPINRKKS